MDKKISTARRRFVLILLHLHSYLLYLLSCPVYPVRPFRRRIEPTRVTQRTRAYVARMMPQTAQEAVSIVFVQVREVSETDTQTATSRDALSGVDDGRGGDWQGVYSKYTPHGRREEEEEALSTPGDQITIHWRPATGDPGGIAANVKNFLQKNAIVAPSFLATTTLDRRMLASRIRIRSHPPRPFGVTSGTCSRDRKRIIDD
ncbi:hypothetical protein AND_002232 [Anopheles darlingi]|uniref:Uncharacterized protein n=1 Tax=Anopheles darlingi TaxID=43151 RepID=W5JSU6_ANODA|nr:hypothetical protein AND_002232 [Anopheles darlingi]